MAYLKIFLHTIKQSEIIGIGPLMFRGTRDAVQNETYNPQQLFFLLHCKGYSIEISSDWYELGISSYQTMHNRMQRLAYEKCRFDYFTLVNKIEELLIEPKLTEEERRALEEQFKKTYS